MKYLDLLKLLAPETLVVIAALAVIAVDLLVMRAKPLRNRLRAGAVVAVLGCAAAVGWIAGSGLPGGEQGMFVDNSLTRLVKIAILVLTVCAVFISEEEGFTEHVGEYLSLMLLGTVGMLLLVSSTNLLMIFIALELTSLSLYVLAAFDKRSIKSAEAALKYFLFGGMSAAFTLFGLSLIYGLTGSTQLSGILDFLLKNGVGSDPLLLAAVVMTVVGFGFKVAAVPFHFWAPDAYEGAPTPSATLIASGSKIASFFVLARLMIAGFGAVAGRGAWHDFVPGWVPVLAVLSAASMIVGNMAAIAQNNVKRLLAYSAIAHAGYALLGVLADNKEGLGSLVYYTITYGLTVAGAFGVVAMVEARTGGARMENFVGLSKREPVLAMCMMVFMLSLAGIPPLAGFFGKFYLFTAAASGANDLGLMWLVFLAVAMSAVSLYYYLKVLKQIYVIREPVDTPETPSAMTEGRMVLMLLAAAVVLLGCMPNLLVGRLIAAIHGLGLAW
jgi:NADH-quinone oxidoreductase subunit N